MQVAMYVKLPEQESKAALEQCSTIIATIRHSLTVLYSQCDTTNGLMIVLAIACGNILVLVYPVTVYAGCYWIV